MERLLEQRQDGYGGLDEPVTRAVSVSMAPVDFLRPTRGKLVVFVVLVGIEYVMAVTCWEINRWLPLLTCPPRIHTFLRTFGYFGYFAFYLLACSLVHLSDLMWRDRI